MYTTEFKFVLPAYTVCEAVCPPASEPDLEVRSLISQA